MPAIEKPGFADGRRGPVTVCKICRANVYKQDATEWVRSPVPGIAHATCAQEKASS